MWSVPGHCECENVQWLMMEVNEVWKTSLSMTLCWTETGEGLAFRRKGGQFAGMADAVLRAGFAGEVDSECSVGDRQGGDRCGRAGRCPVTCRARQAGPHRIDADSRGEPRGVSTGLCHSCSE